MDTSASGREAGAGARCRVALSRRAADPGLPAGGTAGGRGPTARKARVRRPRSDEGGMSGRARYPLGRRPRSGFDVFRAIAGQGPSVHSGCRACARARHRRQQHALHDRQRVVHPRSLDPACRTDGLRRVERGRAHAWPCLPGARRDPIRIAKPRRDFRVHHRPRDAGRARSRAGSRHGELCFTGDDPSGSRPTDARPRLSPGRRSPKRTGGGPDVRTVVEHALRLRSVDSRPRDQSQRCVGHGRRCEAGGVSLARQHRCVAAAGANTGSDARR